MEHQVESQSQFSWFDELPAARAHVDLAAQSSPSLFAIQHVSLSRAVVTLPAPPPARRAPLWGLALAAIAGASTFVLGAALLSLV